MFSRVKQEEPPSFSTERRNGSKTLALKSCVEPHREKLRLQEKRFETKKGGGNERRFHEKSVTTLSKEGEKRN